MSDDKTRRVERSRDPAQSETRRHTRELGETAAHPRVAPQPPPFQPAPPARPARRRRRRSGVVGRLARLAGVFTAIGVAIVTLGAALYILFPPPRMNVLILGVDARPGESYVTRADVIILATVDPRQPYAGMLSIPRDTFLDVPGYGRSRVNAAHVYGENARRGGGPALVAQTIANNFGVPVHRTLRLNFQGFVAIVDAAGGVDIDVPSAITDTAYPTENYGVTTIHFEPGRQHMDGQTALIYARTRHSSNDFVRAGRQQQVMVALFKRLTNPINVWRLPIVYAAFVTNVETDLTPLDVVLLLPAAIQVGPDNVERVVLSRENSMVVNANVPGDLYLLAPNWPVVNPVVDGMFRR